MGDINPGAARTFGLTDNRGTLWVDTVANAPSFGVNLKPVSVFKHRTFYFADADNAETFALPHGAVACAWQSLGTAQDIAATIDSGGITFSGAANSAGWLHVLIRGALSGGTSSDGPVSRGTSGFVHPATGAIHLNHKSATPNTLTYGGGSAVVRRARTEGLRLRIFPITPAASGDRWKATTGTRGTDTLLPGLVAVAWQADDTTQQMAVTLDAAGDVIFTTAGVLPFAGYVWCWTNH